MTSASCIRRLGLPLLALLAAAFFAVGCGGDDGGSGGSSGGSSTEAAGEGASGGGTSNAKRASCSELGAEGSAPSDVAKRQDFYDDPPAARLEKGATCSVEVTTTKGKFAVEVDGDQAPIAASNFIFLVNQGYYDGIVFHRVLDGFMVQGGDPTGTGSGGPGYDLKDDEGVEEGYERGVVAMANAGPDTGGSQFFVVQGDAVQLPPDYVKFGTVDQAGMKTIDALAKVPTTAAPNGEPSQPKGAIRITKAVVVS